MLYCHAHHLHGPEGRAPVGGRVEGLIAGARALGLELTGDQLARFRGYRDLLADWNQRVNLTSAAALEDVERVHFLDSLALLPVLDAACPGALSLMDVGAGAGFPGLPMKLARPGLHVVLVEATGKKAEFLRAVVAALALDGVDVVNGRAEDLGRRPDLRERFDVVTARALGPLPATLELTLPFCRVGGAVLLPRAGDVRAEVVAAAGVPALLGGGRLDVHDVRVPGLRADAAVVVCAKAAHTPDGYPRRSGMPATRPLGRRGPRMRPGAGAR